MNSAWKVKIFDMNLRRVMTTCASTALLATMGAIPAHPQVPPDIEAQLLMIGPIVDPACTAKIYRPLMPPQEVADQYLEMEKTGKPSSQVPMYPGITIERDVPFGPNPKDVVDIFHAEKGTALRAVLIFIPGGPGNKIELHDKEANAFYDNIMRWATENGMVGVAMQRHGVAPGTPSDFYAGAKDVSAMLQWVEANISKYTGNPDRMFIWAHSAGNGPLGIYAGHPELYGPKGIGVRGIVFMSGQFNIIRPDGSNVVPAGAPPGGGAASLAGAGSTCGAGGPNASDSPIPGRIEGQPGGPNTLGAGPGGGTGQQVAQDELVKRSSLAGLEKTSAKIFLGSAEFDPGVSPVKPSVFNQTLHDELCKLDGANAADGQGHCPMLVVMKGESHMSELFSIDTPDKTVSGAILTWMRTVK
jgi:triacylglycerol lipase